MGTAKILFYFCNKTEHVESEIPTLSEVYYTPLRRVIIGKRFDLVSYRIKIYGQLEDSDPSAVHSFSNPLTGLLIRFVAKIQ